MKQPLDRIQFTQPVLAELFTNHELLMREAHRPKLEESVGVRRVGILGGGTAGWFTALALRAQLPSLEITVIESPTIPIVGVGEASVPSLVAFLHHYLKLDVTDFVREVKPTWKQGIRFEWGLPGDYVFQAPFDWEVNGVGMLGAMGETANVSSFTLQANLMAKDVTPILKSGGTLQPFLHLLAFAYHLDNARFVTYLAKIAVQRGVNHLDCNIVDATLAKEPGPDGEPHIASLRTEDGRDLEFDLYVDCSGFRSVLLEQKLEEKYESYASSLFTDRALAFNVPHGGKLKPYTTARTMNHGWAWNIPIDENDHMGYVHASSHCSEDDALAEAKSHWPDLENPRVVRFKSGRHERMWVGNVFAIGNSYAFVEPLESTGLLMITRAITSLVRAFPIHGDAAVMKRFVNTSVGRDWDRLRWFLAAHFKFNRRLDTPFWQDMRENADVSGLSTALDLFRTCGPLSLLPRAMRTSLNEEAGVFFYGLHGLDCILLGQKVAHPKLDREPSHVWRQRRALAQEFVRRALPQAEAQKACRENPEWMRQLVSHPGSWVAKMAALL